MYLDAGLKQMRAEISGLVGKFVCTNNQNYAPQPSACLYKDEELSQLLGKDIVISQSGYSIQNPAHVVAQEN